MKPIFVIQLANENNQIDFDQFKLIVQEIDNALKEDYHVLFDFCQNLEVNQYHLFSIENITETTIEELKKLLSIDEIKIN